LKQSWSKESVKVAFLICDAPGHGKDICDSGDDYPKGSKDGYIIQDQIKEFADKEINFTIVRVNNQCDKMIKVL